MAFALPTQNTGGVPWDVTPEAKATSDRFFAQLDTQNKGVIEGDVAVPFMLQSQLDEGSLASIW
jgi:epidermal growth factor receptor substrate 15